jgi:hypothetical protein
MALSKLAIELAFISSMVPRASLHWSPDERMLPTSWMTPRERSSHSPGALVVANGSSTCTKRGPTTNEPLRTKSGAPSTNSTKHSERLRPRQYCAVAAPSSSSKRTSMSPLCVCVLFACASAAAVAVDLAVYVDPEWTPSNASVVSDGSLSRPWTTIADAAGQMPRSPGVYRTVAVYLAARVYSGDSNCFQFFNLMATDSFNLTGAGDWAASKSTDMATFVCDQTQPITPKTASRALWLGFFGGQQVTSISFLRFANSTQTCGNVWLDYDIAPGKSDGTAQAHACSDAAREDPVRVCGGVAVSTGRDDLTPSLVFFASLDFRNNSISVSNGLNATVGVVLAARAFAALHAPLVVIAKGDRIPCDVVSVANSSFVSNVLTIEPRPVDVDHFSVAGRDPRLQGNGGGAAAFAGGTINVVGSLFSDNRVSAINTTSLSRLFGSGQINLEVVGGGAVMVSDVTLFASSFTNFSRNSVAGHRAAGGAVAAKQSWRIFSDDITMAPFALFFQDCLFVDNAVFVAYSKFWKLEGFGGAVMTGLVFKSCFQLSDGGVRVFRTQFTNNSVIDLDSSPHIGSRSHCVGGAVFAFAVLAIGSDFRDNTIACDDASASAIAHVVLSITNATFVGRDSGFIDGTSFSRDSGSLAMGNVAFDGLLSTGASRPAVRSGGSLRMLQLNSVRFIRLTTTSELLIDLGVTGPANLDNVTIEDSTGALQIVGEGLAAVRVGLTLTNVTASLGSAVRLDAPSVSLGIISLTGVRCADSIVSARGEFVLLQEASLTDCRCTGTDCAAVLLRVGRLSSAASRLSLLRVESARGMFVADELATAFNLTQSIFRGTTTLTANAMDCTMDTLVSSDLQPSLYGELFQPRIVLSDSVVANNTMSTLWRYSTVAPISTDNILTAIRITDSIVAGNRATGRTFSVFQYESRSQVAILVRNVTFVANAGLTLGGKNAVYVDNSSFVGNSASDVAPLLGFSPRLTVAGSVFDANSGALAVVSGDLWLVGSKISNHESLSGPIMTVDGAAATLGVRMSEVWNSSSMGSTLIDVRRVRQLFINDSTFSHNSARAEQSCGGVFYLGAAETVALSNATFVANTAHFGGVFCVSDSVVSFAAERTQMAHNAAAGVGDEVFVASMDGRLATSFNCTTSRQCSSFPSMIEWEGRADAMLGVALPVSFRLRDAFGRELRSGSPDAAVSMARYALFVLPVNCTTETASKVVCVIERLQSTCGGTVTLLGATQGDTCALTLRAVPLTSGDVSALFAGTKNSTVSSTAHVQLTQCAAGFGRVSVGVGLNDSCVPCSASTFNIDALDQQCHACTPGLFCAGRNLVASQAGFWSVPQRGANMSVQLLALPCDADVCLAGTPGDADQINRCVPDRHGTLCAQCSRANQTPVAASDGVACVDCDGINAALVALLVAAFGVLAFVLHLSVVGTSARLKVLFFYAQTLSLMLPKQTTRLVFAMFDFRPVTGSAALGGFCIGAFDGYQLIAINMSYPVLLAVLLAAIFALRWVALKLLLLLRRGGGPEAAEYERGPRVDVSTTEIEEDSDGVPLIKSSSSSLMVVSSASAPQLALLAPTFSQARFLRSILSFVFLSFSVVLSCALKLYRCDDLGDFSVLAADARHECRRGDVPDALYERWRLVSYVLFAYTGVVVVLLPLVTWRRHVRPKAALWRNKVVFGFLTDGYREHAFYYENVVLLRRVVVGFLCALLPLHSPVRVQALLGVNLAAMVVHTHVQPFVHREDNWAESLSLTALTFNAVAFQGGSLFGADRASQALAVICISGPAVIIGGSIAVAKLRKTYEAARAHVVKRQQQKKRTNAER